ncbi:NAD(P)H-hydrate dehydratase [Arthrobacter sp. LAPM80]|uniref:NAD(P)H-hydrate dehydratase n=1 Tax=Arthrobacter sp. LAPM80 TaxID=3141788 RepID=UPI00398B70B2
MISAHSAAAVRAAEQPLLDSGLGGDLMRTAAYGLAMGVVFAVRSRGRGLYGAKVTLLVSSGNNGGDALYAGAWLSCRGAATTALLTGDRTHPDALAAFEKAGGRCVALGDDAGRGAGALERMAAEAGASDVVVDGLLGTGGRGGLREPAASIVAALEELSGTGRPAVVACDLPSGVDATTGEVHLPVLHADLTVTFGAYKSGLLAAPGGEYCGAVRLVDLGIGQFLGTADVLSLEPADLAALLPLPATADHKYTRGVAGIVAGSTQYPGAGLLAAAAASACGPGMVRYLGPDQVAQTLHLRNPEVVCSQDSPQDVRVQAWLVGPGIDGDPAQMQRAGEAIVAGRAWGSSSWIPTVVDAGALALVKPVRDAETPNAHLVLTPHAGELAAQFARSGVELERPAIEASPVAAARRAAALFGAVVLLKGPATVVAAPDGTVFLQANGTPRLATAGSGDTLAGILVALLAMGCGTTPSQVGLARTAALAAALHGELAHEEPGQPLNAGMLAARIPTVWARLSEQGS